MGVQLVDANFLEALGRADHPAPEAGGITPEALERLRAIVDGTHLRGNNEGMTDLTRDELNARLDASAARTELAVSKIDTKLEVVISQLKNNERAQSEVRSQLAGAKWWAVGTGVAVLLGVWQINTGVVQSVIAAFEAGRNVSQQPAPQPSAALPGANPTKPK